MYFRPYVRAVCSSKVKRRFVIKFSDIALVLTQFRQQMDSIYSIILRYATSEGIRESMIWSVSLFPMTPWLHTVLSILLSDNFINKYMYSSPEVF